MRRVLLGLVGVLALASVGSAKAATYYIDPTVGDTIVRVGGFGCPNCTTAIETPVYTFSPGDTVDFGLVTLSSTYGTYGSYLMRFDPMLDWAFGPIAPVQLGTDQFFMPSAMCDRSTSTCADFLTPPPAKVFDLVFTVPDSGQIQLAWQGRVIDNVTAVPEPATWAMMLVGFAALGFVGIFSARSIRSAGAVGDWEPYADSERQRPIEPV